MSEENNMIEEIQENPQEQTENVEEKKDVQSFDNLPSVTELIDSDFDGLELDNDEYAAMTESTVKEIKEDELVKGTITKITKDEVFVDIGFKSVGIVPRAELLNSETLQVNDSIDVYIENMEDKTGKLLLSRRRADFMRIWDDIINLYNEQKIIQVKILRRIKGGMVVDLMGIEAFLPGSQIDVRPVRDFDQWVGQVIDVKVVKVNHPSENVVVSHKVLLEEQLSEQREAIISKLEKGLVLEGTVKAISDFGVFVDLGGVDGLVHITDLSWGRVTHPSEIVKLDSTVKVVVLDFDTERKRISLGMKQLTPHPWDTIGDKYEKGSKVTGKVVSLTDYGAFIEIEKGIEGLIHISEMSWTQHIKHPSQMVSMGQMVEAIVLNIDREDKKLALGMKQLEPDPWEDLLVKYPVGSNHTGIVRNLTNFGIFVELEPGVDGLVHISDLSWTKKIRHPGEFVKKGDNLEVVVISIDSEQRRIALGHKQIKENPWNYFGEKYKVGSETEAKIERIIEKGVIVELPDGVDGFVPVSQLSFAPIRTISDYFQIGDVLPLEVVEFDKESKKIVLSVVELLRKKDEATIIAYNAQHPVPNADKFSQEPTKHDKVDYELPAEFLEMSMPEDNLKISKPKTKVSEEASASKEVKEENLQEETSTDADKKSQEVTTEETKENTDTEVKEEIKEEEAKAEDTVEEKIEEEAKDEDKGEKAE